MIYKSACGGNVKNVNVVDVKSEIYTFNDIKSAIETIKKADEFIVLLSSFDVDESGGDGSLNPNSTYDNWMWILVRTNGGKWQHVDHGY